MEENTLTNDEAPRQMLKRKEPIWQLKMKILPLTYQREETVSCGFLLFFCLHFPAKQRPDAAKIVLDLIFLLAEL